MNTATGDLVVGTSRHPSNAVPVPDPGTSSAPVQVNTHTQQANSDGHFKEECRETSQSRHNKPA